MMTLIDKVFDRLGELVEKLAHIHERTHHMGKALDNLTAAVAENNRLIQLAVDAIAKGGTVTGEDPVAVQALADQLGRDDAALASVLAGVSNPPTGILATVLGISGQGPTFTFNVDSQAKLTAGQTLVTKVNPGAPIDPGSCVVQSVTTSGVVVVGTADFIPQTGNLLYLK
jgi:hypothetical protein